MILGLTRRLQTGSPKIAYVQLQIRSESAMATGVILRQVLIRGEAILLRLESHYASDTLTDRFKIRNEFAVGRGKLSVYKSLPVALMSNTNLVIR